MVLVINNGACKAAFWVMMSCVFGKSYFPILVNRLESLGRVSLSMVFCASFCPGLRLVVLLFFLS